MICQHEQLVSRPCQLIYNPVIRYSGFTAGNDKEAEHFDHARSSGYNFFCGLFATSMEFRAALTAVLRDTSAAAQAFIADCLKSPLYNPR